MAIIANTNMNDKNEKGIKLDANDPQSIINGELNVFITIKSNTYNPANIHEYKCPYHF